MRSTATRLSAIGPIVVALALVGCKAASDTTDAGPVQGNDSGMPSMDGSMPVVDAGPDAGPPPDFDAGPQDNVTPEEALNAMVSAYCTGAVACGTSPSGDLDTCVAVVDAMNASGLNSIHAIVASILADRITMDRSQLTACETALVGLDCSTKFNGDFRAVTDCASALKGKLADGAACIASAACTAGSDCFPTDPAGTDKCEATCGKLGVKCHADADCTDGKVCSDTKDCATPTMPPGAMGTDCSVNPRCEAGLFCFNNTATAGAAPTCQPPSDLNGHCSQSAETCKPGLKCLQGFDGHSFICQMPPGAVPQNQPCFVGQSACEAGLTCVPPVGMLSGKCLAPKAKGEACTEFFECGGYVSLYFCDSTSHKCVDRPTSGPCPSMAAPTCALLTSYCDSATDPMNPVCAPIKMLGDQCNTSDQCGSPFSGTSCDRSAGDGKCVGGLHKVCTP